MTENIELMDEKNITDKVVEFGRNSLYLGLGVVSVVQDNVQGLVVRGREVGQSLVERGEKVADANKGKVTELVEMPQTVAKDTAKNANDAFEKYSEQVLTRVNIPTSAQINTMTRKVSAVDRKLDKMIKENAAA
jgi:hypothetical protein